MKHVSHCKCCMLMNQISFQGFPHLDYWGCIKTSVDAKNMLPWKFHEKDYCLVFQRSEVDGWTDGLRDKSLCFVFLSAALHNQGLFFSSLVTKNLCKLNQRNIKITFRGIEKEKKLLKFMCAAWLHSNCWHNYREGKKNVKLISNLM